MLQWCCSSFIAAPSATQCLWCPETGLGGGAAKGEGKEDEMWSMILTMAVFLAIFITIGLVVSHYTGRTP